MPVLLGPVMEQFALSRHLPSQPGRWLGPSIVLNSKEDQHDKQA